jgi:hypothetical protein
MGVEGVSDNTSIPLPYQSSGAGVPPDANRFAAFLQARNDGLRDKATEVTNGAPQQGRSESQIGNTRGAGLLGDFGLIASEEAKRLAQDDIPGAKKQIEAATSDIKRAWTFLTHAQIELQAYGDDSKARAQAAGGAPYDPQADRSPKHMRLEAAVNAAQTALDEAQTAKAHAEDVVNGKAPLRTEQAWRSSVEEFLQQAGTSLGAGPVKFVGIIGGYAASATHAPGTEGIESDKNAVYRAGSAIDAWVKRQFPGDPGRQDEVGTKIARAAGFMATLFGTKGLEALAAKGPETMVALSKMATPAVAMANSGVAQYEDATRAMDSYNQWKAEHPGEALPGRMTEVSEADRAKSFMFGTALGLVPSKATGGVLKVPAAIGVTRKFEAAAKTGAANAGSWAAYTAANNAVARALYDPNRSLGEGVGQSAAVGFAFGAAGRAVARAPKSDSGAATTDPGATTPTTAAEVSSKRSSLPKSVEEIIKNPNVLTGKTPLEIEGAIGKTPGWKVRDWGAARTRARDGCSENTQRDGTRRAA